MKSPLVSALITARNKGQYIEKCIESIKASTYKNIEIIVLDNESEDDTKKVAERQNVKVVNVNPGISNAYNIGFEEARGNYIFIVNADSKVSEHFIEKAIDIFESDKTVAVVGGLRKQASLKTLIGKLYQARFNRTNKAGFVGTVSGNFIVKKELYDKVIGKLDRHLVSGEEGFICNKLTARGYKIVRVPELSMVHLDERGTLKDYFGKHLWYAKGKAWLVKTQAKLDADVVFSALVCAVIVVGVLKLKLSVIGLVLIGAIVFAKMFLSAYKSFGTVDSIAIGIVETVSAFIRFFAVPFYMLKLKLKNG